MWVTHTVIWGINCGGTRSKLFQLPFLGQPLEHRAKSERFAGKARDTVTSCRWKKLWSILFFLSCLFHPALHGTNLTIVKGYIYNREICFLLCNVYTLGKHLSPAILNLFIFWHRKISFKYFWFFLSKAKGILWFLFIVSTIPVLLLSKLFYSFLLFYNGWSCHTKDHVTPWDHPALIVILWFNLFLPFYDGLLGCGCI